MGTTATTEGPSTVDRARLQRILRVLAGDELVNAPVRKKLLRIVALAAQAFPDCYAAATVDAHDGEVCTNLAAYRLDQAQYRAGPGTVAMASRKPVRVDVIAACAWTEFRRAAAENRIASSISLPLSRDGIAIGVLNLYARAAAAFAGCEAEAAAFAAAASRLLAPTWPSERR